MDLGRVVGGGTPSRSQARYWIGPIPWASVKDFSEDDVFLHETAEQISLEGLASSASTLVPENTPVMCTRMAVGRCALTTQPTAINQDLKALLLTEDLDRRFLIRLLRRLGRELDRVSIGSTVRGITLADLLSLDISYPTAKSEQSRIAAVLDTMDKAIAKTNAEIAKLRQIRAGLVHDLLTRGVDIDGQLRDPIRDSEQFHDTLLGRIPTRWNIRSIRQCLISDPQNGVYKPATQIGEGTLLVGQTGITEDRGLDFRKTRRAEVSPQELAMFGLQENDLLVSRVFATLAGVGLPALVPPLNEPAVYESNMMRLRVDSRVIAPRMLFESLRSASVRAKVRAAAQLSNQASINQPGLNPILIGVPQPDEQAAIVSRIVVHDGLVKSTEAQLVKLQALRAGLMADLLTGRTRVPEGILATESAP
jgi:type I restriction enzyme S subunit